MLSFDIIEPIEKNIIPLLQVLGAIDKGKSQQLRVKLYKDTFAMRYEGLKCYTNGVLIEYCLNNLLSRFSH